MISIILLSVTCTCTTLDPTVYMLYSHTKIIPKCSPMDPPIIDLPLGLMDTV